jgi:hypothetical protein
VSIGVFRIPKWTTIEQNLSLMLAISTNHVIAVINVTDPMDDLKNLKSFVVPETVSRPSSLSEDWEFRTVATHSLERS